MKKTLFTFLCILAMPGCKIIMNNGAKILRPFNLPLGAEIVINKGSIE